MAPDTDTKPEEVLPTVIRPAVQQWNSIGFRIMLANIISLMVLGLGVIGFSEYKKSLIFAELSLLEDEARLWARSLTLGTNGTSFGDIDHLKKTAEALAESSPRRVLVFSESGALLFRNDQKVLIPISQKADVPAQELSFFRQAADLLLAFFPIRYDLPRYAEPSDDSILDYPNATEASQGKSSLSAWVGEDDELVFSAAVPLRIDGRSVGTLLLIKDETQTGEAFQKARVDMIRMFLAALAITLTMTIYVSATVARPLNRLARAAEAMRQIKNRAQPIPDMSARGDEIGALSVVLREMTDALWVRMDTIERFAADVAHELKNPLTSLRSALETLPRIEDTEKRARLMAIMQQDTQRLDRLITDIAKASRLDAELSRESVEPISLDDVLQQVMRTHVVSDALLEGRPIFRAVTRHRGVRLDLVMPDRNVRVMGNDHRLMQVFENLIGNAFSFSPEGGQVTIAVDKLPDRQIAVRVEDDGPGIPEAKLEEIFNRFYSERPVSESFGIHSGLGLSISRQIVTAAGGQIRAENRKDPNGKILGARFTVLLRAAA